MNWDLRRPGAFGAAYAYAAILDRASRWFPSGGEWWIYAGCPALAPKGRAWLKDR